MNFDVTSIPPTAVFTVAVMLVGALLANRLAVGRDKKEKGRAVEH